MTEHITIIARRVVEEIEVRISRTMDRPQPVGVAEIDVTPKPRLAKRRAPRRLLLAAPRSAA